MRAAAAASETERARRTTTAARRRLAFPRMQHPLSQHAAAYLLYLGLSLLFFGRHAIADPGSVCACVGDGDPGAFMWSLVWWPHAILDGANPFVPDVIWAPDGANLARSGAAIPALSIALAPITLAAGPVVAYNVAALLMPVLAASFAYNLCRYLTGAFGASLVGGFIFGFGSYMAAHLLGHLILVAVFLVPAAVHLVLKLLDGAISKRRFVIFMAAVFAVQLLLSVEVVLTGVGFGALALLLGYAASKPERRPRISRIVAPVLLAGGLAILVTSPYLYWLFDGLADSDTEAWKTFTNLYPADAVNLLLPTEVTALGHQWFTGITRDFTYGNLAEATGYVGPALLVIVVIVARTRWNEPATRVLVGVAVVSYVLSLGSELNVAGEATGVPLPWALLHSLPVLYHLMPARLFMYGTLAIAITVALWLAQGTTWRGAKWTLAAVAAVLLVPNLSADYWGGRPTNPPFFTSDTYKRHLKTDEIVLVLPYARHGNSMLWQAETGMYFRMVEGYISPEFPPAYRDDPFLGELLSGEVGGGSVAELRDFAIRRQVTTVVVETGNPGPWPLLLAALKLKPTRAGGVLLYHVPDSWRA